MTEREQPPVPLEPPTPLEPPRRFPFYVPRAGEPWAYRVVPTVPRDTPK